MIKSRSPAPIGSFNWGNQSIGRYSQTKQKRKEQFLCEVFPLPWQTGKGLLWFEWIDRGIQIHRSGISCAQWERKRRKVYYKLSRIRRPFAEFLSGAYNCSMTVAIARIQAEFAREAF